MEITKANAKDYPNVKKLYKKVLNDPNNNIVRVFWNGSYPLCELKSDIKNGEMFLIKDDNRLVGCFVLTTLDDPDYQVINWSKNKNFLYISRLAIAPEFQRQGYGKKALEFVYDFAKKNNFEILRVIIFKNNIPSINLFIKHGFKKLENTSYIDKHKIFYAFEELV